MELLTVPAGDQRGQHRHGLIALPRQEQSNQIVVEGLT